MQETIRDAEMQAYFTQQFIAAAFAAIDRMERGTQLWSGWCVDLTGDELADQIIDLLETYY